MWPCLYLPPCATLHGSPSQILDAVLVSQPPLRGSHWAEWFYFLLLACDGTPPSSSCSHPQRPSQSSGAIQPVPTDYTSPSAGVASCPGGLRGQLSYPVPSRSRRCCSVREATQRSAIPTGPPRKSRVQWQATMLHFKRVTYLWVELSL